jgi:hypothetical protein
MTIETTPEKELLKALNKNLKINIISCTFLDGEVLLQVKTESEASKLSNAVTQAKKKATIEKEDNYYFVCFKDEVIK